MHGLTHNVQAFAPAAIGQSTWAQDEIDSHPRVPVHHHGIHEPYAHQGELLGVSETFWDSENYIGRYGPDTSPSTTLYSAHTGTILPLERPRASTSRDSGDLPVVYNGTGSHGHARTDQQKAHVIGKRMSFNCP